MNAQDLKNSILQLAIQGKLVEQRKEEGTAKELIEEIKAEKERLIKEKKIKKEKPLVEITEDEVPFEIPESWEWVRLVNIVSILGDGIHGTPKYDDMGEYYFINGNNLTDGNIEIKDNTKRVNSDEYMKYKKELNGSTVLVSINGTIGNVAFYNNEKVMLGKSACYFNLLLEDFRFYLYWIIKTKYFLDYAVKNATGSTIKNVSLATMKNFIVPFPPLAEQKRIIAKIEELIPYIEKYSEAHSKLEVFNKKFPEDMQKSILQYAIQGKLVEQREEEGTAEELYKQIQEEKEKLIKEKKIKKEKPLVEITEDEVPFEIPENWKWVRLGQIGMTNIGLTYKPTNISSEGTIVLRSSNIQNGKLAYDDIVKVNMQVPENKMCQIGDILICARNGSKRLVGKAALIDKDNMCFGAFMAIYRSICNEYILYVINSAYFRNSLLSETGTTTINQITQDMLRQFIVPLPPLEEQKRIVAKIEEMLPYCKQLVK